MSHAPASVPPRSETRAAIVRHALVLEYLTVGWNLAEGAVAVAAALAARSVALLGFGIDSWVEMLSGAILIWRLRAERAERDPHAIAALDRRAHRMVGGSLYALAAWIAGDAALALYRGERPTGSVVGVAVTLVSIVAMILLARAKRRAAAALGSHALAADAFQASACMWLSVVTLVGIGLNGAFGWWWADPVAALGMCALIVKEGRAAWRGDDCGC